MILRPAGPADVGAIADIDHGARTAALPSVRWAHSPQEVRGWIADTLLTTRDVWVAEQDGVVGFMALRPGWIEQLYLRPSVWRRGIGSALMARAKALHPAGLQLYCFQCNARARAFYEVHGFAAEAFTDGAGNEEREPDILYAWAGAAIQ